ncbi:MAG: hypothetical protein IKQ92_15100 [Clostridia bacterium]|nr:hypothetical protein [Clostridia bacterium]
MKHHSSNLTRLLCLILTAFLLFSAVSCADSGETTQPKPENPTTSGENTEEEEQKKYLDNLPEEMDYGGYEMTFLSSYEDKSIALDEEVDDLGDVVNEAYWKRNTGLESRMNVKIVLAKKTGYGDFNPAVSQSVTAGTDDYDILVGHTRFNINLAANGYMLKLNENGFTDIIDLTQPYWSDLYISNVNYKDNIYWVTGDMSHNFIGWIYATFVNATFWQNIHPGENIYDIVLEGKWTLDKMNALCGGAYQDKNGNTEVDDNDSFGVIMQQGHTLNGMVFASGITFTGRDDAGNYKIVLNSEQTVDAFSKLHNLFYNTEYGRMLENAAFDTTAVTMFTEDRVLFCPYTFEFCSKDEVRAMESDFYVIPLPKCDEKQENYRVNQYDGVPIYGVGTTLPKDKYEMVATFLEAFCSMTSQTVIPAYYDLALKNKYSRDATTAQMIDLIHDNVTADFAFYWGDSCGGLMNFFYDNISKDEIASSMKSKQKIWDKALAKLCEKLEG